MHLKTGSRLARASAATRSSASAASSATTPTGRRAGAASTCSPGTRSHFAVRRENWWQVGWSTETQKSDIRPLEKTEILAETASFGQNTLCSVEIMCFGSTIQAKTVRNSIFWPKLLILSEKCVLDETPKLEKTKILKPKLVSVKTSIYLGQNRSETVSVRPLHVGWNVLVQLPISSLHPGNQYKIRVMFTGTRVPIHTYGRIHILLIDENGLNETHTLTQ